MTASADKVQFILQSCLQQTLPLVKKGIFSQQQLRQVMLERQKHQNKLYSSTYKLSHYLKAIEFQYDFQRQRLFRIKNQQDENINPLFRKQGKTDFSIIRRIIKLWDRTMHKYRFRTYLWKQYLSFCIIIKSKKHFYKALTNALRFLPFQLELWKIGVRYEVQIGRNLWKARKLFYKGLKLVPTGQKNIQLTKQLIKFQLQFVETLQSREKIIQGQDQQGQNDMKFIIGQNKEEQQQSSEQNQGPLIASQGGSELLKLREYHEVLFVALVDSITKNYKSKTYFQNRQNLAAKQRCEELCDLYLRFLEELKENEENELIEHILTVTIKKVKQYRKELSGVKLEQKYEEEGNQMDVQGEQNDKQIEVEQEKDQNLLIEQASEHCLLIEEQKGAKNEEIPQPLTKEEQLANEILESYNESNKFDEKRFTKSIKELCLKPVKLSVFLDRLIPHFMNECLQILKKNEWLRIPLGNLQDLLRRLNDVFDEKGRESVQWIGSYLTKQLNKINAGEYMGHVGLLREVIEWNKRLGKIDENNKLFRSLLVNCKQNIEFIERAKGLFVS